MDPYISTNQYNSNNSWDLKNVIVQESQVCGLKKTDEDAYYSSDPNGFCEAAQVPTLASRLDHLDEIKVHQHLDVIEVCLGWERNNRYSLYNKDGEQILYVYESAQCVARQCYGSLREFTLIVTDNDDNHLLYLQRPLRCSTRCFYACCCLQELAILTPQEKKESIAVILERWTMMVPQYDVHDPLGSIKFTMQGDCCHYRCCCNIHFTVKSPSGYEMATVCKTWRGCRDVIGARNDFIITYLHGNMYNRCQLLFLRKLQMYPTPIHWFLLLVSIYSYYIVYT
ncbi:phospholipid scramblase 2 [Biomphalaria pfeifferi]|uniref:Phospholipid scramblase n=1 Tax=Biomphalaria pfeifferi TaxID=112525 RepID=A0AAD8BG65_BIOPF|nr:phospholipid scramblase 2 [Biomphalaria pfeifferi]